MKDRLFRDSDGLWKVERRIDSFTIEEGITTMTNKSQNPDLIAYGFGRSVFPQIPNQYSGMIESTHFNSTDRWYRGAPIYSIARNAANGSRGHNFYFIVPKAQFPTIVDFNQWLTEQNEKGNSINLVYEVEIPIIENLSQSDQDKLNNLRSFQDSNYVYTVLPNKTYTISERLKPTLHATFKGGGWYNRWKTEDELRKHQAEIDDKADNASTEESINNAIANIQVLQQELEAAATANELDDFIDRYNEDMESRAKDERASEENLSTALSSISTIEKDLGEMSETWTFIDRFIKNTPEGIVVGNDTTGSYILIKEDRLSFYSNSQEVAFISQNLMEISRGAFVEQIQIAKYQFEESTNNHLTIRYVG